MMITIKKHGIDDVVISRIYIIAITDDRRIYIQRTLEVVPPKHLNILPEDWDCVVITKMS